MKELVLHVGMMKTATTYLQGVLQNNREELKEDGWLYPGKHLNHQREAYGLCGKSIYWYRKVLDRDVQLGNSLIEEIKSTPHSVIVSSEALSSLSPQGINKFVEKVGYPTRVVVTIRSIYKVLPSAWQQYVKGGSTNSFEEMLNKFVQSRNDLSGPWRTYAYGNIIKNWSKVADVHTVIIPTSKNKGEPTTWELFQEACGLPNVENTKVPTSQSNISLPLESINFLIEMNKVLEEKTDLGSEKKVAILNYYLRRHAYPVVGKLKGTKISPPDQYISHISSWENEEIDMLSGFSRKVYGDIDSLFDYARVDSSLSNKYWVAPEREILAYVAEQMVENACRLR